MSFVQRQAAHCDQCSHEWLVVGASTPTHCAKCKSRRWNRGERMQGVDCPDCEEGTPHTHGLSRSADTMEIPICGKTWWEEGEQYECLMDSGHIEARVNKHGLRGMVRTITP